jgi:hypothetical protein
MRPHYYSTCTKYILSNSAGAYVTASIYILLCLVSALAIIQLENLVQVIVVITDFFTEL